MTNTDNWRIWDERSDYGELLYRRAIGELEEMESSKALCDLLKPIYQEGWSVADIGCGAGHYLRSLRKRVDENIQYTGIDATARYIELASKAFPEKASFRVGDICSIPAKDQEFDLVVNSNVLLHLPPPLNKPIRELLRISSKYVVIRTVFGHQNYIIKELGPKKPDASGQTQIVKREDQLGAFNYFNLYTETYIRETIEEASPNARVEIISDTSWKNIDNRPLTDISGTTILDRHQISGNILLDWRFVIIAKN